VINTNIPIAIKIECARGEILNTIGKIQEMYDIQPCMMDGILTSILADVRGEAKIEIINATNVIMAEKNKELDNAKKAAKKILKTEPVEREKE